MLNFLIKVGVLFATGITGFVAIFVALAMAFAIAEFFGGLERNLERKYGLKGSILMFFVGSAVVCLISAIILTIAGV